MYYGTFSGEGSFLSVDPEYLISQPPVVTQMRMVEVSLGKSFVKAYKKMNLTNSYVQEEVKKFVQ